MVGRYRKLGERSPSTAAIGNQAVLGGVRLLTEVANLGQVVEAKLFMGVKRGSKSKLTVSVTLTDSTGTIKTQWDAVCAAFSERNSILLFHLRNHYALIFALREYELASGEMKREVLTARKGQRPTAWLDFNEVREIVLSWEGYKIMKVTLSEAADRLALQCCRDSLLRGMEEEESDADYYDAVVTATEVI